MASRNPYSTKSMWRAPSGEEYPIKDAPPGFMVPLPVITKDIQKAVPKDPNHCALAECWMRIAEVGDAQIGIDKCYLVMKDPKTGELYALRCKTNAETRAQIDHFDKTGEFPDGGFMLYGIPESERLDSKRQQQKRTRERWNTLGKPKARKPRRSIHLRNASRRAQINVEA